MSDFHLPTFTTKRLTLRHMTENDFAFMRELDSDPQVVKYLGHGQVRTEEETKASMNRIFAAYEMFDIGLYIIEDSITHEKLGCAGFIPWTLEQTFYWEVGYSLKPSAWGKGYATEAHAHFLNWGIENLNTDYLVSFIHPENLDSIHVATKNGMNYWKDILIGELTASVYRTL